MPSRPTGRRGWLIYTTIDRWDVHVLAGTGVISTQFAWQQQQKKELRFPRIQYHIFKVDVLTRLNNIDERECAATNFVVAQTSCSMALPIRNNWAMSYKNDRFRSKTQVSPLLILTSPLLSSRLTLRPLTSGTGWILSQGKLDKYAMLHDNIKWNLLS